MLWFHEAMLDTKRWSILEYELVMAIGDQVRCDYLPPSPVVCASLVIANGYLSPFASSLTSCPSRPFSAMSSIIKVVVVCVTDKCFASCALIEGLLVNGDLQPTPQSSIPLFTISFLALPS